MNSRDPIFIGGMFKSGTSLLRAMLGQHSRLYAGLETQWLAQNAQVSAVAEWGPWLGRLSTFFDVPRTTIEKVVGDALQVEICLERLMTYLTFRTGKARWVEKTPHNVGRIDRILSHWPTAKVLHIIRDPRDVYASMVAAEKWTEPFVFAGHWCNTIGVARDWVVARGGMHPAYLEFRYERLVLAPEETMRQVLAFLGETWEPKVAMFDGQPQDFERVRQATGKVSTTLKRLTQPLTESRIGLWHSVIDQQQWAAAQAELDRFGYGQLVSNLISDTESICSEIRGQQSEGSQ